MTKMDFDVLKCYWELSSNEPHLNYECMCYFRFFTTLRQRSEVKESSNENVFKNETSVLLPTSNKLAFSLKSHTCTILDCY